MTDYNTALRADERRATLIELRTIYTEAADEPRRRAVEIAMMVLTEPLDSHVELFGDDDEWEHPCLCAECLSCG